MPYAVDCVESLNPSLNLPHHGFLKRRAEEALRVRLVEGDQGCAGFWVAILCHKCLNFKGFTLFRELSLREARGMLLDGSQGTFNVPANHRGSALLEELALGL
jgi:hypothetical protein